MCSVLLPTHEKNPRTTIPGPLWPMAPESVSLMLHLCIWFLLPKTSHSILLTFVLLISDLLSNLSRSFQILILSSSVFANDPHCLEASAHGITILNLYIFRERVEKNWTDGQTLTGPFFEMPTQAKDHLGLFECVFSTSYASSLCV